MARCCCDLLATSFFSTVSAFWLTLGILTEKTYAFCIISLFRSFFFNLILLKKPYYLHQIRLTGLSRAGETLTCKKNLIIYIVPGTFFSRRWLRGGLKCDTVVKLTFSKTFFTFFASFLILVFWAPFGEK